MLAVDLKEASAQVIIRHCGQLDLSAARPGLTVKQIQHHGQRRSEAEIRMLCQLYTQLHSKHVLSLFIDTFVILCNFV